jgi:hypothetical protein
MKRRKTMKKLYTAPSLEAKEYAQLENVFTWCDRVPNNSPECYDQSGSGNDADKIEEPSNSSAHSNLGPPPTSDSTGTDCGHYGGGSEF